MTDRLALYNAALGTYIGTQRLTSLTEDVTARYALDAVYTLSVTYILERGLWKFATRTVQLTKDVTDPTLQRQYSFSRPSDFVRLVQISSSDNLETDLQGYRDFGGKWYSDVDPIYISYVSNDPAWGFNLAKWPANFTEAVASWMAYKSVLDISKDRGDRADLLKLHKDTLSIARQMDAVDEAVKRRPPGRFTQSRGVGAPRYLGRTQ